MEASLDTNKKLNIFSKNLKKHNGIHNWRITRLVCRSGLLFNRTRRASDSILPLLMKTHEKKARPRTNSTDSTFNLTPFETSIDYLAHHVEDDDSLHVQRKMKRSASDALGCMRRNKLDESISQYEMILHHLKNYDQFTTKYPAPSSSTIKDSKPRQTSFDQDPIANIREEKEKLFSKTSSAKRQTQSLSRNMGRTFSEFIMNDLFLTTSNDVSTNVQQKLSISHASSQTDICEAIETNNDQIDKSSEEILTPKSSGNCSPMKEEIIVTLNELDTALNNDDQELPALPNNDIHVIVKNIAETPKEIKVKDKDSFSR